MQSEIGEIIHLNGIYLSQNTLIFNSKFYRVTDGLSMSPSSHFHALLRVKPTQEILFSIFHTLCRIQPRINKF